MHDISPFSSNAVAPPRDTDWFILKDTMLGDPLSVTSMGGSLDGLGCAPLGAAVTEDDFQEIIISQRNLRKLGLLDEVSAETLRGYGNIFSQFIAETDFWKETTTLGASCEPDFVEELADTLGSTLDDGSGGIRIFLGLHSGFQRTGSKHFWASYHALQNCTEFYISKDAQDILGTLLHTALSSEGLTRRQCIAAEISFGMWHKSLVSPHGLPLRLMQDISSLTPDESILLLQRVSLAPESETDELLKRLQSATRDTLVDVPTLHELKTLNTVEYIKGTIGAEELVATRLRWHCQCKSPHLDLPSAISLFRKSEEKVLSALKNRNQSELNAIFKALESSLQSTPIDSISDIFNMSVFCTVRKIAFEEVYIEVTDRNPLFNDQPDQAAAFAELFALGSRCESYFDMSPSQFGQLLSEKFRSYYCMTEHQPPIMKDKQTTLDSAYSEAQMDVDINQKSSGMPTYQKFTFLSVFAIPALIDITMLTTTGHGLYLSVGMSDQEQHSATVALMISLLLSGAIGTWITCGGTYYLASMAFSAMNYFVVTRLLGGFAFTMIAALIGFIAFVTTTNFHEALIFVLYLIALTMYLCLLAALANYQFIGSGFQSVSTPKFLTVLALHRN